MKVPFSFDMDQKRNCFYCHVHLNEFDSLAASKYLREICMLINIICVCSQIKSEKCTCEKPDICGWQVCVCVRCTWIRWEAISMVAGCGPVGPQPPARGEQLKQRMSVLGGVSCNLSYTFRALEECRSCRDGSRSPFQQAWWYAAACLCPWQW